MNFLSATKISASAPGKAILIGEHAVVYGYKALAVALPDVRLKMTFCSPQKNARTFFSWENAWETTIQGQKFVSDLQVRKLLVLAFEKALAFCHVTDELHTFLPQKFLVESQIPLGGGMGGSAAMSTCLLNIASQIAQNKKIKKAIMTFQEQIYYTNEIDCLFHFGKASGLDVTTIASNGIIEFQRGVAAQKIKNQKEFYLVIVDSQERSQTAQMIKKVEERWLVDPVNMKKVLFEMGKLTEDSVKNLGCGDLVSLAKNLNHAQNLLDILGVSTQKIRHIICQLKRAGALAGKLTGAGGGGLVLGLFDFQPSVDLVEKFFSPGTFFVTQVSSH
jgi:mevalonate kinase